MLCRSLGPPARVWSVSMCPNHRSTPPSNLIYAASGDDSLGAIVSDRNRDGVDVVIDCVGREETLVQADRLVRPGGRVVAVGYSITSSFSLPTPRFVLEEIELIGSRYV